MDDSEDGRIGFRINSWDINNEFKANKSDRKSRSGKKHNIYGSFIDSDEDSDEDDTQLKNYPKPLKFVSSGIKQGSELNSEINSNDDSGEDNELKPQTSSQRSFRQEFNPKRGQQFAGMRGPGSIGTDQNFGRWESHTKGIGARLLQKMGYEPGKGLGKNLQGITAPIEAKKRLGPGALGLYGSEHKHRPLNADEDVEENIKTQNKTKSENKWKQSEQTTKKAKKVIKSADQIIAENLLKPFNENEYSKVKIIDMTGREQRILKGYHEINQNVTDDQVIDQLSDIAEEEIDKNTKELKRESIRYNGLEEEIQRIKDIIEKEMERCQIIENLMSQVSSLSERYKQNDMTIEELLESYDRLKNENPLEFEALRLHEVLIPTAFPLIRKLLSEWKPFEKNAYVKELFKKLKRIDFSNEDPIYDIILWEIWMPIVRQHIYDWPSIRQCDEIISFLDQWRPLLPDWLFDNIIEQTILPQLQKEVEEWNPLTDTIPIHSWLHPWLPTMADRSLEHLYDPIRHKLSNALTNWHPSDGSAKLILKPWNGVFSAGAMEAFLNINIVPKLELSLQSFIINPHQQCLDGWNWVMSWQDLISTPVMASILEKNFFPKWLNVLYNWLSSEPNFIEVNKWFIGWKNMFSSQLLSYPSIGEMFNRALQMMDYSSKTNGQMKPFQSFYAPNRPQQTANTINHLTDNQVSENSLNFRELVEKKARERGILFMPIPQRLHEGKQIFKFGNFMVYIDNKVLFVLNGNNWVPNSLQTLIESTL